MNTPPTLVFEGEDGSCAERSQVRCDDCFALPRFSVTGIVVGFYFSFRAVLALAAARWLNIGSEPGVVLGILCGYVLLILVAFQSIGAVSRPVANSLCDPSYRWVLVYLGFSGCSLAWSETVSVQASFVYWSAMATDVAIVVLLLRGDDVVRVSHSLMKGFIWSSCLLAMIAWGMPAEVDLRLGDLEFFNTNQIGNLCAIGIFFAQYLASRRDGKWKIGLLLLSLTLLRSMSKATISAFIVSQCILVLGNRLVKGSMKILIAGASVAAMLLFWGLFQAYYDIYSSTGNQAETLTGRTTIWAFTLDAALEKPWTGNGIDAMWKVFPPFGNELFEARHAENELLQQFFSYGIAGVAMLFGLYGSLYRQTRKKPKDGSRDVLRCLMLFIVLRGLVEAEPIDLLLPLWMITMLGAIVADSPAVQSQSQAGEIANPALLRRLGQAGSVLL